MDMKILDTTGKRIEFLLDLKDIRKNELVKYLGVAASTVSGYISGARKPDIEMLTKIANFLNVTTDFLLMRTDDYTALVTKEVDGKKISIKLKDKKCHLTEEQIQLLFETLENAGWDIEKALKDNFQKNENTET